MVRCGNNRYIHTEDKHKLKVQSHTNTLCVRGVRGGRRRLTWCRSHPRVRPPADVLDGGATPLCTVHRGCNPSYRVSGRAVGRCTAALPPTAPQHARGWEQPAAPHIQRLPTRSAVLFSNPHSAMDAHTCNTHPHLLDVAIGTPHWREIRVIQVTEVDWGTKISACLESPCKVTGVVEVCFRRHVYPADVCSSRNWVAERPIPQPPHSPAPLAPAVGPTAPVPNNPTHSDSTRSVRVRFVALSGHEAVPDGAAGRCEPRRCKHCVSCVEAVRGVGGRRPRGPADAAPHTAHHVVLPATRY